MEFFYGLLGRTHLGYIWRVLLIGIWYGIFAHKPVDGLVGLMIIVFILDAFVIDWKAKK